MTRSTTSPHMPAVIRKECSTTSRFQAVSASAAPGLLIMADRHALQLLDEVLLGRA